MILVSPTEPTSVITALADTGLHVQSHSVPEQYGADYLMQTVAGTVGVQRKTIPADFLASLHDGRLYTGLVKLQRLDVPILLLEGEWIWTSDGALVAQRWQRMTKTQVRNALRSVQRAGVQVEQTTSPVDTAQAIAEMAEFYDKAQHQLLLRRPKVIAKTRWGETDDREYQQFLLQGLPNVGPTLAAAIVERFGGVPWRWTCTNEELISVPGVGKVIAARLMKLLDGSGNENCSLTSEDKPVYNETT